MPSTVDKRPFEVGRNLALSPGAVVFRSALCEVIQYAPATDKVYERPLLFIPPQINKFYIMDLAPGRSFVEYAVKHGLPMFTISWRNPTPQNRNWGLDDYITACKDAIAAACEITGSPDCNVLGVCAGGITTSLMLGHLAASNDKRVNAVTLLVTMLDTSMPSMTGMFATEDAIKAARDRSAEKGVLDGADMARVFAWLRPNDLVWKYWVNNYLLGNDPAPFDILYWNSDSTNLPAKLHAGFLELFLRNPLTRADDFTILGTPIDLRAVKNDLYLVAGMTDHICAWRACYRATRMFGGRLEFVLGSSGHIQSLVNPPGNFKARYYVGSKLPESPDEWLKGASENKGTWWDHWIKWIAARSGSERAAPKSLGSEKFKPSEPAPGLYVHEHH
jgi:polyhydroxyalkanoate synthase subunit PhaC